MGDNVKSDEYLTDLLAEPGQEPVDADKDTVEISLPDWYDAERFRRGQQFYRNHLASMYSAMFMGLLSILAVPSILNVLMKTGSSATPMGAYRRYMKTIYHVMAWNEHDLKEDSMSWQSISHVRKTHHNAKRFCEKSYNITITQFEMAITQFGFMGFIILRPKMMGIHLKDDNQLKDIVHFWRVLGYLMGIKDECNLCTDTVAETRVRLETVLANVLRPALDKPDANFKQMTAALVSGLRNFVFHLQYDVVLYLARRFAGCDGYEYFENEFNRTSMSERRRDRGGYRSLGLYKRAKVGVYVFLHEYLLQSDIVRGYVNFLCRFGRAMNFHFPFTAIVQYGSNNAYVRIFADRKKIE